MDTIKTFIQKVRSPELAATMGKLNLFSATATIMKESGESAASTYIVHVVFHRQFLFSNVNPRPFLSNAKVSWLSTGVLVPMSWVKHQQVQSSSPSLKVCLPGLTAISSRTTRSELIYVRSSILPTLHSLFASVVSSLCLEKYVLTHNVSGQESIRLHLHADEVRLTPNLLCRNLPGLEATSSGRRVSKLQRCHSDNSQERGTPWLLHWV